MLTINTGPIARTCDGFRRRDFLRIGALGLGGLSLAQLGAPSAQASSGAFVRDKSVVLLFLAGGPSQYETFDPKPDGLASSTREASPALELLATDHGTPIPALIS